MRSKTPRRQQLLGTVIDMEVDQSVLRYCNLTHLQLTSLVNSLASARLTDLSLDSLTLSQVPVVSLTRAVVARRVINLNNTGLTSRQLESLLQVSVLHYHWSRSNKARLSLVESLRVMLPPANLFHKEPARASKYPILLASRWFFMA